MSSSAIFPEPYTKFPAFIFLLSDHTTRSIAVDVANKLWELNQDLRIMDFLGPVHDAVVLFVDHDCNNDLGDPRQHALGPIIDSMEKWANDYFGEDRLGATAYFEARDMLAMMDHTLIFRDASWAHIRPFLLNYPPHDVLIVDLGANGYKGNSPEDYKPFASRHLLFPAPEVDAVVTAIVEASK